MCGKTYSQVEDSLAPWNRYHSLMLYAHRNARDIEVTTNAHHLQLQFNMVGA